MPKHRKGRKMNGPLNWNVAGNQGFSRFHKRQAVWVDGSVDGCKFQALVFPAHAESESFELGTSRISKLWVARGGRQVAAFERGWDQQPVAAADKAVVARIEAELADKVFGAVV